MSEFEKAMIEILGKDAFFSTNFKVTDNVQKLAFAVNYLHTQLFQCKRMLQDDDKDYVDGVSKSVIEILKGERR
jgi:hypothetical protein